MSMARCSTSRQRRGRLSSHPNCPKRCRASAIVWTARSRWSAVGPIAEIDEFFAPLRAGGDRRAWRRDASRGGRSDHRRTRYAARRRIQGNGSRTLPPVIPACWSRTRAIRLALALSQGCPSRASPSSMTSSTPMRAWGDQSIRAARRQGRARTQMCRLQQGHRSAPVDDLPAVSRAARRSSSATTTPTRMPSRWCRSSTARPCRSAASFPASTNTSNARPTCGNGCGLLAGAVAVSS